MKRNLRPAFSTAGTMTAATPTPAKNPLTGGAAMPPAKTSVGHDAMRSTGVTDGVEPSPMP